MRRSARLAVGAVALAFACAWTSPGTARADPPKDASPAARTALEREPSVPWVADVDTWPMQDGCPGRTRATRTRPILDATEVAWTYEAPGEIVGDPLVSAEWVAVCSQASDKAFLDVVRLVDGKTFLARRTLGPEARLLGLWRDVIYLSSAKGPWIQRVSLELGTLLPLAGPELHGEHGCLVGERIVAAGSGITSGLAGGTVGTWRQSAYGIVGAPCVGPDGVHVLTRVGGVGKEKWDELRLATYRLDDGSDRGERELGFSDPGRGGLWGRLVAYQGGTIVQHVPGVETQRGSPATATRIGPGLARAGLTDVFGRPVAWGRHLLFETESDSAHVLARSVPEKDGHFYVLATEERHLKFRKTTGSLTVAAGLVLHPAGVFELETGRIRGAHPWPDARSVVPARETMLVVDATGRRLTAWRAPRDRPAEGPRLAAPVAGKPHTVPGAVAVAVDGGVRAGALSLAADGEKVSGLGKGVSRLADLGLVLDGEGRLVHGPDAAFVARNLPRVAAHGKRKEWTALARRSIQSCDDAASRRVLDDLLQRGGRTEDYVPLRDELDRVAASKTERACLPKVVEEVAARRAELGRAEVDLAWRAFASLPESVSIGYRAELLRAVLGADPAHAEALAWLRGRLPAGVVPPTVSDAVEWLDVVEASAHAPITAVAAKAEGTLSDDERTLAAARASWRADLVGLRSERLLVVTPVVRPGRIARCIALGELACAELDRLFGVEAKPGVAIDPLVIHLCASQEEYVKLSPEGAEAGRSWVTWTAGHYRPSEGVSYLFVPDGDDAFEQVVPTFVHELTHHWVDRRMPRVAGARRAGVNPRAAGYFLEEGFATLVEEGLFDLRRRSVRLDDPRADSIDALANASTLHRWDAVLDLSHADFARLSHEQSVEVPYRWVLGRHRLLSQTNLFYVQAGALCRWMYEADGGKRRPVLLAWLQDLHAGRTERGDFRKRLGLSAAEIGNEVSRWARALSHRGG